MPPDFENYYTATLIKAVWHWRKERQMERWDEVGRPEIGPCMHGHVISKNWRFATELPEYLPYDSNTPVPHFTQEKNKCNKCMSRYT